MAWNIDNQAINTTITIYGFYFHFSEKLANTLIVAANKR